MIIMVMLVMEIINDFLCFPKFLRRNHCNQFTIFLFNKERFSCFTSIYIVIQVCFHVFDFDDGHIWEVGETGFEPATSCSQSRRATKLRYTPSIEFFYPTIIQVRDNFGTPFKKFIITFLLMCILT